MEMREKERERERERRLCGANVPRTDFWIRVAIFPLPESA